MIQLNAYITPDIIIIHLVTVMYAWCESSITQLKSTFIYLKELNKTFYAAVLIWECICIDTYAYEGQSGFAF